MILVMIYRRKITTLEMTRIVEMLCMIVNFVAASNDYNAVNDVNK